MVVAHNALLEATRINKHWSTEEVVDYLINQQQVSGKRSSVVKSIQTALKEIKEELVSAGRGGDLQVIKKGRAPLHKYKHANVSISIDTLSEDNLLTLQHALNMLDNTDLSTNADELWAKVTRNTKFARAGSLSELRKFLFFDDRYRDNKNRELVPLLCNYIINKQPIELWYLPFSGQIKKITLHPYSVREYNRRYYLCGMHENGLAEFEHQDAKRQVNLGIDRILTPRSEEATPEVFDIRPAEDIKFVPQPEEFGTDYYANVIGLTVPKDRKPEKITLAISPEYKGYMETKPLHASQKSTSKTVVVGKEKWFLFEYSLVVNKELINNILHMGKECKVIGPASLQEEVKAAIASMATLY